MIGGHFGHQFLVVDQRDTFKGERVSPKAIAVHDSVPSHRKKCRPEILPNFERLQQAGIGPFADSIVSPEENVRALAALCCRLELVRDILLGFHFDGDAQVPFEFATQLKQRTVASIVTDPDEEFAISPGKTTCRKTD